MKNEKVKSLSHSLFIFIISYSLYTAKLSPHPQVRLALGLLK